MPVYTYQCENCGVRFDRRQSFSERQLTRCPECNKNALHRVYQPVGLVFKGSGFYVTDNRSPSSTGRASNSTKDSSDDSTPKKSADKSKKKSSTDSS